MGEQNFTGNGVLDISDAISGGTNQIEAMNKRNLRTA